MAVLGIVGGAPEAEARQTPVVDTLRVAFQDGVAPSAAYSGTRDTKLRSDAPYTAFGTADFLEVDAGPDYTALIRWDLSSLPDSAVVYDATLVLHVTNVSTASYQLYSVLRPWEENRATWVDRSDGASWEIPGASGPIDRGDVALGNIDGPLLGEIRIPLRSAAVKAIQTWISDPTTNHGFVIQNYETADDGLDVASREAIEPLQRPRLEISYSVGAAYYLPDPPQALFDVVNERGTGIGIVSVDGSPSDIPGTAVNAWHWNFGDGFQSNGVQADHTYDQPGTYEIELTVVDTLGAVHTASKIIIVDEGENAQATFQQGVFPLPSYEGAIDTKLQADDATRNFGTDVSLFVDGSPFYSTLMRWELSAIAPGVEVTAATMTVDVVDPTADAYELYPLSTSWSESEATWEEAFRGTPWALAGAETANPESLLGTLTGGTNGPSTMTFDEAGLAWLTRWINEPSSNYGFVIQNFATAQDGLDFQSSEALETALRPRLELTYRTQHHVSLPERVTFGAWPNPFRDNVSVRVESDLRHAVELELYDMLGRRVLSQTLTPFSFGEARLDTSFLASGVYALILTEHGTRVSSTRLVAKQ